MYICRERESETGKERETSSGTASPVLPTQRHTKSDFFCFSQAGFVCFSFVVAFVVIRSGYTLRDFKSSVGHIKTSKSAKVVHAGPEQSEFFYDNLLVRIHFITVMMRWTGFTPWDLEISFPDSLASTFLTKHSTFGVV